MKKKQPVSHCLEMDKRRQEAEKFYYSIFDLNEIPSVVTDEASLYDIYLGDELDLIEKVQKKYRFHLDLKHFSMPFWKLIDIIEKKKDNQQ